MLCRSWPILPLPRPFMFHQALRRQWCRQGPDSWSRSLAGGGGHHYFLEPQPRGPYVLAGWASMPWPFCDSWEPLLELLQKWVSTSTAVETLTWTADVSVSFDSLTSTSTSFQGVPGGVSISPKSLNLASAASSSRYLCMHSSRSIFSLSPNSSSSARISTSIRARAATPMPRRSFFAFDTLTMALLP